MNRLTERELRSLAKRIAKDLFTDGTGRRAQRLVMETVNSPLRGAGWGEQPVADLIERHLDDTLAPKRRKAKR